MKRRQFLRTSIAGAGALMSPFSMSMNLQLGQRLIQQSSAPLDGYKALVCVFLYGGHDSLNLLVPTASETYNQYAQTRQNLAYAANDIVSISPNNNVAYPVGMPSSAQGLIDLFNNDKLSLIANVGPMRQVSTKAELKANSSLMPPQLFSHNDQQHIWQSGTGSQHDRTGWAGRMADLVMDTNNPLPMNLTTHGANLWQAGASSKSFAVNTEGPELFAALNPQEDNDMRRYEAFNRIRALANRPFEQEYSRRISAAEVNNKRIIDALGQISPETTIAANALYPANNALAEQFKMTANLIQSQSMLGHNRQIFLVGMGGFDTHDNQNTALPMLVSQLSSAMAAFQQDLTQRGLSRDVLTFTQSDFGRTLTSNGDGTDHGWGGHHLVMGDAVTPKMIAGKLPSFVLGSEDDFEDGRIIPTTSIEQYASPLARWFGLNDQDLTSVFPNLARFDSDSLDILSSIQ